MSSGSISQPAASQEELLAHSARGDRDAFTRLMAETQGAVYRLALAVTGNTADAEDVLQETYLAAWKAAASFRGEVSVRGWLLTIARHEAWRSSRRRARAPQPSEDLETLGLAAGWGTENPEQMAQAAQDAARLRNALASLSAEYQEVLTLRDLQGVPGEEVAAIVGLALPAMKSRLHRARLALAGALREEGVHGE